MIVVLLAATGLVPLWWLNEPEIHWLVLSSLPTGNGHNSHGSDAPMPLDKLQPIARETRSG